MGRNPLLGRLKIVLGRLVLYKSIKLLIFFGWSIAFLQFILFYTIVAHRFIASRCGSKKSMAPLNFLELTPVLRSIHLRVWAHFLPAILFPNRTSTSA